MRRIRQRDVCRREELKKTGGKRSGQNRREQRIENAVTKYSTGFRGSRNLRKRCDDRNSDDRHGDEAEKPDKDRRNEFAALNPELGAVKAVDQTQNDGYDVENRLNRLHAFFLWIHDRAIHLSGVCAHLLLSPR